MMGMLSLLFCLVLAVPAVAVDHNGSALYTALFQPYSDSTPVFKNVSKQNVNPLIAVLLTSDGASLSKRATNDQPTGTCGPGSPCTNGACCSNTGVCSYAPSSCAKAVCISNCDAKAPCGQYANASSANCPLNVCCSQYGFCGTTDDFCGTGCQAGYGQCGPPPTPSCGGGQSVSARTIGYYESWASKSSSTRNCDKRDPEDIDLTSLTSINFAFAFFDPTSFRVTPMDANAGMLYSRFTALKQKKPSLETWISIGGWSFNDASNSPNTRTAFSDMVSSSSNRATFINGLINFMVTYGFDGVDIDWEYPGADDRGGKAADSANFVSLLREMRSAFATRYGISATIPSSFWYLQHFDVKTMQNYLDWFNFMSYDIHGVWDSTNKFTGPYIKPHTNLTEIRDGLGLLWRAGVSPSKVVLGLGWYGRSFTLSDPSCSVPNGICQFSSGAKPGLCTNSAGTLSNAEIFRIRDTGGVQIAFDKTAAVKWMTWGGNQWVSYDDGQTIQLKKQAANQLCLGGAMIWALDQDNTNGDSMSDLLGIGTANGVSEAESQAIKKQFNNATLQNSIAQSCYWTFCGDTCKAGWFGTTAAKGQVAGVQRDSVCSGTDTQTLCCAPGTIMGTCSWQGYRGVGLPCTPACDDTSAVVVAQNSNNYFSDPDKNILLDQTCTGGFQAYCCSGFMPSPKATTGNLFLYGQGGLTKRGMGLEKRGAGPGVTAGLVTVAACALAFDALIAAAPFTFGLSLLGEPAVIGACLAAGIVMTAVGFAAKPSSGGSGTQSNPGKKPPVASPITGVPISKGKKTKVGQWPKLDFGTVPQSSGCDCVVTYTCKYGLGFDEVCDNQRWGIDKLLNHRTVYHVNPGGRNAGGQRNKEKWTNSRIAQYRTLVQGQRQVRSAHCEVDEFPMGDLKESTNNQPQVCRLVNGPANGKQGNDYQNWKAAQWHPCSTFREEVCKIHDDGPPVTWKFGSINLNDPRVTAAQNPPHFIQAYGFDSQTANSLCFASYSYINNNGKRAATMVADHGFRGLLDDPMFGKAYGWPMQNYKVDPHPQNAARPTDVASAAFLKRDDVIANCTSEDDTLRCGTADGEEAPAEQELEYHLEDMCGQAADAKDCDILYDEDSGNTMYLNPKYVPPKTAFDVPASAITSADPVIAATGVVSDSPTITYTSRSFAIETRSAQNSVAGKAERPNAPAITAKPDEEFVV